MAERSDNSILVGRYAAAWFQAMGAANAKKLAEEAASLQASFANDPRLLLLLRNPTTDRRVMAVALKRTADKAGLSKITSQFLAVLANAGRQALLPKILIELQQQIEIASGVQHARLVSAAPLSAEAIKEFQTMLSGQLSQDVRLVTEIDETLLGGVQIEMNSWLIDASLTGQISRLERHLKSTKAA